MSVREENQNSALVLFSGGQDSTTCLAWAMTQFPRVETVGFKYGQRHGVEIQCRSKILQRIPNALPDMAGGLGPDHVVDIDALGQLSDTALTRETAITLEQSGLPNTFVPGRNLLFITYAAVIAYWRGLRHLVLGVCETDYSGYPDCRDDTVKAMQLALNLGMEQRFVVHTPLMWTDKAETWRLAERLGGTPLVELIVEATHTCYLGYRSKLHEWGYGCGECPACQLRAQGWARFVSSKSSKS